MTSYNSRSRRLTKGGLITSLLVASTLLVMSATLNSAHALALYSFTQTQQGLVKQDTLTTGDTSYWTFSGSAVLQGAPTTSSEDAQGLHLGIKAAVSGQWAGYYAVSPDTSAYVFHAVITLPSTTISDTAANMAGLGQPEPGHHDHPTLVHVDEQPAAHEGLHNHHKR